VVESEVTAIAPVDGSWKVTTADGPHPQSFAGVVVTGSGKPFPALDGAKPELVFNGSNFWSRLDEIRDLMDAAATDPHRLAIIIGAGGTAGAVAAWMLNHTRTEHPIRFVSPQPTIFTRNAGFFQDRLFADSEHWQSLDDEMRETFLNRAAAGVIWADVADLLAKSHRIEFESGSALQYIVLEPGGEAALLARRGSKTIAIPGILFVDTRGFDTWWFARLLPAALRSQTESPKKKGTEEERKETKKIRRLLEDGIDDDLALDAPLPHNLHVPMLAARRHPAAPNLMALGAVADLILRRYLV
jgi:mycobactin lysine-N-oxygenase